MKAGPLIAAIVLIVACGQAPPPAGTSPIPTTPSALTITPTAAPPADCTLPQPGSEGPAASEPSPALKFRVNAFAYDCSRREVVTFGGSTESMQPKFSNETWLWRQGKWIQAHPSHSPPARASALIGYDPAEHIVVLVGGGSGYVGNERIYLSDTWAWDGADWSQQLGPAAGSPTRD